MTVRVTVLKGGDAGRYYLESAGLGGYYLDDGEPTGGGGVGPLRCWDSTARSTTRRS